MQLGEGNEKLVLWEKPGRLGLFDFPDESWDGLVCFLQTFWGNKYQNSYLNHSKKTILNFFLKKLKFKKAVEQDLNTSLINSNYKLGVFQQMESRDSGTVLEYEQQ